MKLDKFDVLQLAEIDACTKCGNCLDLCTAVLGSDDVSIAPSKKIKLLKKFAGTKFGFLSRILKKEITEEDIKDLARAAYACTMCSRCELDCHIGIKLQDVWLKLREVLVEEGKHPEALGMLRDRLVKAKNVSFDTNEGRVDWIDKVPDIPEDRYVRQKMDIVYFVGCVSSFSPRVFKLPRAVVQIFRKADLDFGVLGEEEWCCGFPLLTSGFKDDFVDFARHNIETVSKTGAKALVTSCPSCYHMWKHVYSQIQPEIKIDFEVLHLVQYLARLIKEKKLKLNPLDKKVTYHDPCDLGRNSGIYDEPREIIKAIPGIEFVELENSRERALCCGGGGNVEAADPKLVQDIARIKAEEIIGTGADIVVTSCQQCVRTMLNALKREKSKIKVKDISELVLMSLESK
ncbi:MAG: (Fe-S)-binding protein [Actinomycetota bacterium]